ncbi:MAG: WD40 repeat domain-containing protein [bacterium]|nr:WD40 repeat domain-containing protein [bacterium]
MSVKRLIVLLAAVLLVLTPVYAQETPVLNAENVTNFASVMQLDFETLPDELGTLIETGWFTLSPDGNQAALVGQDGSVILVDVNEGTATRYPLDVEAETSATILDMTFAETDLLVALYLDGVTYKVAVLNFTDETTQTIPFPVEADTPIRVWLDSSGTAVWLEVMPADPTEVYYVARLRLDSSEEVATLPSGPQNDPDAFVRIGRIRAPLAVTSTPEGLVKLWNLETGEVTAQVQLENTPVFGRIDETSGRYLAWRDPNSESLNRLDFEAGENQFVASLGGEYVQAILLSREADVILGVAIGDAPVVVVWDVESGERVDLGEYRTCNRVPDMVALSQDGTTLVVGCDMGLDVWRVQGGDNAGG